MIKQANISPLIQHRPNLIIYLWCVVFSPWRSTLYAAEWARSGSDTVTAPPYHPASSSRAHCRRRPPASWSPAARGHAPWRQRGNPRWPTTDRTTRSLGVRGLGCHVDGSQVQEEVARVFMLGSKWRASYDDTPGGRWDEICRLEIRDSLYWKGNQG